EFRANVRLHVSNVFVFFFNDTGTAEIYTLSLHDALPISERDADLGEYHEMATKGGTTVKEALSKYVNMENVLRADPVKGLELIRSEEHTSELQSRGHLVCRLLLEKKKTNIKL